jgi:nucleotide-binding universal stress UspA family protein
MKTILVPTDFSEISKNAIDYAVEIAKVMPAKIVLFYAFHVPVITSEAVVIVPAMNEIRKFGIENLNALKEEINTRVGYNIVIGSHCVEGFAIDEINSYTKINSVDLIVMGMHGAGYLVEKLIGSVTTALLQESNCPVLAIDQKVKFRAPKKIVLACDYKHIKQSALVPLKSLAALFDSHIYILNVSKERELVLDDMEEAACGLRLEHAFESTDHSFHFTTNKDVVDGINDYVSTQQIDMVVMIPRKHSVLRNIFREPNTKKIAFHTTVPVLALHEQ